MALFGLHFSGCTAVTKFTNYSIDQDWSKREKRSDGTWVHLKINSTPKVKTIIPIIYDSLIYKEPYTYYFTIWGNFEKINSVNAYFLLNNKDKIKISADAIVMNKGRKKGADNRNYFPAGKHELNVHWENVELLDLHVNFSATDKDGESKEYDITYRYNKNFKETIGNKVWLGLMSV